MILLADFSVIRPDFGLLFWTTIIFLFVWFVIGRFAFKPIAQALKDRESSIGDSLKMAESARAEMATLKAENDVILNQAREQSANIIREAKATSDSIIESAKTKAKGEAQKIVDSAMREIENQKNAAINEVKNQAGLMALDIAGKVLRKELAGNADQVSFVNTLVKEIKLN